MSDVVSTLISTESTQDHTVLLTHKALQRCTALLVSLGGVVAADTEEDGLELLICPLLRCVGNLSTSCPVGNLSAQVGDVRIVAALCVILQACLQTRPSLARESAWVLNNLTACSTACCAALLSLNLVPGLIQLLQFSQGINTTVLRVLANTAHKKKDFCVRLFDLGLLPALCATLKMANQEMVTLSLDVLFMLLDCGPQMAEEFVNLGGRSLLETFQYNTEEEIRRKATHLLECHLLSP